jgi:IS605 OrfB family transposase
MKIIRSSKCSVKFATDKKKKELQTILNEYGQVVNIFIDYFWDKKVDKTQLLKPIVDIPKNSWLSARLRKVAAREALDMISASKERWKDKPSKLIKPVHKCKRMYVSCTIAELKDSKEAKQFDAWLHIASIGNKITMDIPIKFHKHYNRLCSKGKRLNSYIITPNYVQFVFEIQTGLKKEGKKCVGIDTGINALASLSTGEQLGKDIKQNIERVKRCKQGSNGKLRARRALKQRIDEIAKEVIKKDFDLIVVESLKNLGKNTKLKRLLSKNIRRSIGTWNWKYWLARLEQRCEDNRVSFRSVSPYYTSQTCSCCGHVDRRNRDGEVFQCQKCDHTDNADINASRNILSRFLTGKYGSCYKPENETKLACPVLSSL